MDVNQQLHLNVKLHKAFKTCKLKGKWNLKKNSFREYVALENGANILLNGIGAKCDDVFYFKKGSEVAIKNSIMEYYDNDVFEKPQ